MEKPNIAELFLRTESPICDAIACIDRSGRISLSLVVNDRDQLVNTISDGDIRRGILAGIDLHAPVSSLLPIKAATPHPRPVVATAGTDTATLLTMMREHSVRQIPLLDGEGRPVDIVILSDLLESPLLPLQAVIMAGGFGRRLRPLTEDLPKPMLPVGGRPVMERIVEQLRDSGISQINVTTHYLPEKIVEHFGDGQRFGVDIQYVNEDRPLGTGGALGLMSAPTETQLIINGDVLTQVDFRTMQAYHRKHRADMTIGVSQYKYKVPYGVVVSEGPMVCRLQEKPEFNFLVNAGIYLIEPSVYRFIPSGKAFNMTDLIQWLLDAQQRVVTFPIFEQWLDIGQHADYAQANLESSTSRSLPQCR
ncbi:MAG: nucleotidyltransferase family protein [Thermoguttaceae bacterium]